MLWPHSHAIANHFPIGHPSFHYSSSSTFNSGVLSGCVPEKTDNGIIRKNILLSETKYSHHYLVAGMVFTGRSYYTTILSSKKQFTGEEELTVSVATCLETFLGTGSRGRLARGCELLKRTRQEDFSRSQPRVFQEFLRVFQESYKKSSKVYLISEKSAYSKAFKWLQTAKSSKIIFYKLTFDAYEEDEDDNQDQRYKRQSQQTQNNNNISTSSFPLSYENSLHVQSGVVEGWVTYREVIRDSVRVRPKHGKRSGGDCRVSKQLFGAFEN
ncbi:hypothetical protein YC2023_033109 [Brassica napus]